MPATKGKSKKLYHSELVKNPRGTVLRFKSDPTDGQFGPYCFVQLQGEQDDRIFSIDSGGVRDEIERTRASIKDGWVVVTAAGSRESSTIIVETTEGGPVFPGDAPQAQAPSWPDKNAKPGANLPAVKTSNKSGHRAEDIYLDALNAAQGAVDRFMEENHGHPPSDEVIRIATTLFIQFHRDS